MKVKCSIQFEIDTDQYSDVNSDVTANNLLLSMVRNEADFPEQMVLVSGRVTRAIDVDTEELPAN